MPSSPQSVIDGAAAGGAVVRFRLLNRTTCKVNVTANSAAYYERVVRLLADLDDAETSRSNASAPPRGRLRVDVPSPLA